MVKYIILHNKHEGCYDFQCYEDEVNKLRLTSITINPPKIFMFDSREQAQDFFEEYINDVDVIDNKCKRGLEVEHVDYCTCGIIELDEDENPILFYNKRNQIFLMEHGPQIFMPPQELKNDVKNLNLTNRLIRKCRTLSKEQRKRYIELGKYCQDCSTKESDTESDSDDERKNTKKEDNKNEEINIEITIDTNKLNEIKPVVVEKKEKPVKEKKEKPEKEKKEKAPRKNAKKDTPPKSS